VARNGRYDVAIIGAGIAGVTLAAQLSRDRRVVLVEQEAQVASHTTGRSAAIVVGHGREHRGVIRRSQRSSIRGEDIE